MRRSTILLILGCVVLAAMSLSATTYVPNYDVFRGYYQIRPGGVTADEADLDADSSDWNTISSGDWVVIPERWGIVTVSLYAYGDGNGAGSPVGGTVDANLYVAHPYGGAVPVASSSWTIGTCQLSHDPVKGIGGQFRTSQVADPNYCWAQGEPMITASPWRGAVLGSGTTNKVGEISFATYGATHIRVVFDNLVGISRIYAVFTGQE